MDLNIHKTESCLCGRTFTQPGSLKGHQNNCTRSKQRLSGALGKAKEGWVKKKKRKIEDVLGKNADAMSQNPSVDDAETFQVCGIFGVVVIRFDLCSTGSG